MCRPGSRSTRAMATVTRYDSRVAGRQAEKREEAVMMTTTKRCVDAQTRTQYAIKVVGPAIDGGGMFAVDLLRNRHNLGHRNCRAGAWYWETAETGQLRCQTAAESAASAAEYQERSRSGQSLAHVTWLDPVNWQAHPVEPDLLALLGRADEALAEYDARLEGDIEEDA